jgi:subtilisin family serine protease
MASPRIPALLALLGAVALGGCASHAMSRGPRSSSTAPRLVLGIGNASHDRIDVYLVAEPPAVTLVGQDWTFAKGRLMGLWPHARRAPVRVAPTGASVVTGVGVTVYLIDSGIRRTHREFAPARATVGGDFVGDGGDGADCHGHGTHVAGVVGGNTYGVAPGARLVALRVADCRGTVSDAALLAALAWAADSQRVRRPAVVSYPLSAQVQWTAPDVVLRLEDAVRRIVANGVTVIAAAGNDSSDACQRTPGRVGAVVTVSSAVPRVPGEAARSRSAGHGWCVDLFAPGERTRSAWWTDDAATQIVDGTSVAAAVVSGVAALYLECRPAASPEEVARALLAHATPTRVVGAGLGSPDRLLSRADLASSGLREPCSSASAVPGPTP